MATVTHGELLVHSSRIAERLQRGELTSQRVAEFERFLREVDRDLLHHRIVIDNAYTRWFREGAATDAELRHFVRQFSVFSNQFLVAALLRVINAPTLQQARAARRSCMNELGVIYRREGTRRRVRRAASSEEAKDREGDPELVSTEGTVDGGIFRFRAAHFEWLLAVARASAWASTTSASGSTAGLRRSTSATSCNGSTAARTPRSPRGPASPSRTGPPPASGRSWRTAS